MSRTVYVVGTVKHSNAVVSSSLMTAVRYAFLGLRFLLRSVSV